MFKEELRQKMEAMAEKIKLINDKVAQVEPWREPVAPRHPRARAPPRPSVLRHQVGWKRIEKHRGDVRAVLVKPRYVTSVLLLRSSRGPDVEGQGA